MQSLPAIAAGAANKVWVVPAELSSAMAMLSTAFSGRADSTPASPPVAPPAPPAAT